ncbi:glycosyltransferase [Pengzhenrongella sicca]|uniref:Glycosyl transferase family 28 C-terminal domain-containing protein n=1 Tax=Pengzhenrongella sicca TaxID=2819238 RepID=A0A8A4ZFF5_9MICO|nr:glycosyltransferase [Pengzhenrongella sicca]QTE29653.1 hypothetical protein J4E96_00895 [Pengzhenrongella sicca]
MLRANVHVPAFVATTGGHLVQMTLMVPFLEPDRHRDALWITHRTAQSESLLRDERRVVFVPPVEARDWLTVLRRTPEVLTALRRHHVDRVYSTGAALALTALPLAPLVGARPTFVESLARPAGPSVAGRVLSRLPWVDCFTQYPANADTHWSYRYSLLDSFRAAEDGADRVPKRIFVTLGTARPWQFRRLVDRILEIVPADCTIVWQTGCTETSDLDIDARAVMPDAEFQQEIDRADVVVSHAGVGTFLRCLEAGKVPVLVPRRLAHDEHIDDHQEQIAQVGSERGLALMREADALTFEDLVLAGNRRAGRVTQ